MGKFMITVWILIIGRRTLCCVCWIVLFLADLSNTMFSLLRSLDCTALMAVEAPGQDLAATGFEIEHFVMDGIINLYNLGKGETRIKALEVYKMRGTDHVRDKVPYKITPDGIKIYVGEKVF